LELDRAVAEGSLPAPKAFDPLLKILWERGARHEQSYIEHLTKAGLQVVRIDGIGVTNAAVSETLAAMRKGTPIIVQGALAHQGWGGRADVLRRVEIPSAIAGWSYEPIDTKLARETKAGAVLQLCLYSDLLSQAQGTLPEYMHVVVPWSEFEPRTYRFSDYGAYFRKAKRGFITAIEGAGVTYPEPSAHCEICCWSEICDKRWRADDDLSLVAGISKLQVNELEQHRITTMKALAGTALPLPWKPDRGSIDSYNRVCEQAQLQIAARESGQRKHVVLPINPGFGLTRLPAPSPGDIF
jgi:predicted RecB family nuclease